jgi:hypothetical protein
MDDEDRSDPKDVQLAVGIMLILVAAAFLLMIAPLLSR